jgi:hypothetical protein
VGELNDAASSSFVLGFAFGLIQLGASMCGRNPTEPFNVREMVDRVSAKETRQVMSTADDE